MPELLSTPSLENIHFPQRTSLIKKLRLVSFIINDIILIGSFVVFIVWVTRIPGIADFFFKKSAIFPFTPVLFILAGAALLFGAKRHLMSTHEDAEKDESPWWYTLIPMFLATTTALLGFINFVHLTNTGVLSLFQTSTFGGLCFFLIGVALIPPFTRILHRFHITQFLLYVVSILSVFTVLEDIYQLFSPLPVQHIVFVPLPTALTFVLFNFGILLRWSNRGFFGNFTLDSTSSMFALRLFLIQLIAGPLIAFLVLALMQKTPYNMYQILTVVVVCFSSISTTLLWFNMKLMYKYDLEHLLMRESLRSHNIDLTTEKEDLRKKMIQLEQEKQQYADKLNTQEVWQDMADTLR